MLSQVIDVAPKIYPFLWQAYAFTSQLFFADWTIPSSSGCQQGDPAGPLLFCLAIHPIISTLLSELVCFYLDDGLLAGDPEKVLQDFSSIIEKCKNIGLTVNSSKCEIYSCGDVEDPILQAFDKLSPGIKVKNRLSLLGAPVTENEVEVTFKMKFEEITALFSRIKQLKSFHTAYFLLRHCFAVPKLTYLLRTTAAWKHKDILRNFDDKIKETLEYIINSNLLSTQYFNAALPVSFGGLGIRKCVDLSIPAFMSSVYSVSKLVNLMLSLGETDRPKITHADEGTEEWNTITDNFGVPPLPASQKSWDYTYIRHIREKSQPTSDSEKAIFLALRKPESNAWLNALPSRSVGTLLENNVFRISMALRLGCKICEKHTCTCGDDVDINGHHGLHCAKSLGRYSRHQDLNNIICRSLTSSKIPCRLEPTGLCRDDGKRVDGMTLIPWEKGQSLVWDATCSDTLAPSYLSHSAKEAGYAAKTATTAKVKKYSTILDQNLSFLPFAVETMGPWCDEAIEFVNKLGGLLALHSGEPRSKLYLTQRIGIAIQRGNAVSIMGTFPPGDNLNEVFYILNPRN